MYYSDYNRYFEGQAETWGLVPQPQNDPPKKKKRVWPKVLALCLVCALLGGAAGSLGTAFLLPTLQGRPVTTIFEGVRPAAVTAAKIGQTEPLTGAQIYAANVNSTVGITTEVDTNYFGQVVQSAASGSGFILTSDGYVVTNYHVIEDAKTIKVTLYDGTAYPAKLVGGDKENDVAVLKIDATGLTPVVVGSSDDLVVGEPVYAIGNPLGELTFSFTGGYVSALDRSVTMSDGVRHNYIQTDTAINSGNSGGPLFNQYGQVVGINTMKIGDYMSDAGVEGLGFAIPSTTVKDVVEQLIRQGFVSGRPALGLRGSPVSTVYQIYYQLPQGLYISEVDPDSDAAAQGIAPGDILIRFDGVRITDDEALNTLLYTHTAGEQVEVVIYRSGRQYALTLTLSQAK